MNGQGLFMVDARFTPVADAVTGVHPGRRKR